MRTKATRKELSTRLLFMARVARRRIEVTERDRPCYFGPQPAPKERAYSVTGNKVRDGSLYTERWTDDEAIRAALNCARRHNPKAAIRVSWCALCAKAGETFDVHEGEPSWHQRRAGAIGAAVSSGWKTREGAEAHAAGVRAAHPGMPVLVLAHRGECRHVAKLAGLPAV